MPFGLCLLKISYDVKNMEKTGTGTGHYVNRLVPKNDIKLLVNVYKTSKIDNITTWNYQNYRYVGDASASPRLTPTRPRVSK